MELSGVWVGFDPRETTAFGVALGSAFRCSDRTVSAKGLRLDVLRRQGLYTRLTERHDGQLWDVISDAPMSTEFAISRFLVPHIAGSGWHLFVDADVMFRRDPREIMAHADPNKAVMVVQHDYRPKDAVKMDGQAQTIYPRKNWSSVMLFNCDHPANERLTPAMVNTRKGRDLHAFCWLLDGEIGALPGEWNWLPGHSTEPDPAIVHFTEGCPDMRGYENQPYADEWRELARRWAI